MLYVGLDLSYAHSTPAPPATDAPGPAPARRATAPGALEPLADGVECRSVPMTQMCTVAICERWARMNAVTREKLVRNLAERRKLWKRRGELLPLSLESVDLATHIKTLSKADLDELASLDERSAQLAGEAAKLWR